MDQNEVNKFGTQVSVREFGGLNLTGQELEFVHQFILSHGQSDVAAVQAGYKAQHGYVLIKRLNILEAIRRYVLMEFQTDAVRARQMLVDVMLDIHTTPAVKRQCAVDILNIANLAGGTLMPADAGHGPMDLSNLTEDEKDTLEALLAKTCRDPSAPVIIDQE